MISLISGGMILRQPWFPPARKADLPLQEFEKDKIRKADHAIFRTAVRFLQMVEEHDKLPDLLFIKKRQIVLAGGLLKKQVVRSVSWLESD